MPVSVATVHARDTVRLVSSRHRVDPIPHIAEEAVGDDAELLDAWISLTDATSDRMAMEQRWLLEGPPTSTAIGIPHGAALRAAFAYPSGADRGGARFNTAAPGGGAWYASSEIAGAIAEVQHHHGRFLIESGITDEVMHYDPYLADMAGTMVVIQAPEPSLLNPDDYRQSQAFAERIRHDGHRAIVYPSVRGPFTNIACLEPTIVQHIRRGEPMELHWVGATWADQ